MPTETIDLRETLARSLTPAPGLTPVDYQYMLADKVIAALNTAGFTVLGPQDLTWGECPGTPGEPHQVSLSLCSGCLEYDPD